MRIQEVLDISFNRDLGKYLGVPFSKGRNKKKAYGSILDKVCLRLVGWKEKLLNLAGRATLVQSTISSIPIYTMKTC